MNKKAFNIIYVSIFAAFLFGLSVTAWLKPETVFSESERRQLATKPEISSETLSGGEFMTNFEEYTTDQFPMREYFRSIKALFSTKILGKLENNKIYTQDGHISKIEYPENPEMIDYTVERFNYIYGKYLKDTDAKVYLSIIPDKNYFLAPKKGYLSIDYTRFIDRFKTDLSHMKYIDVIPLLSSDDYYFTDSHWKQESIQDIAVHLGKEMGTDVSAKYEIKTLGSPFMGVYAGQSALPTDGDTLKYLTNNTLENCTVTYYNDMGMPEIGNMYDMEKAEGNDPYEMFLSGTQALVVIENPNAKTDKELVLFRDSFGSSIAPLFAQGYKTVTIVDIRYIHSDYIGGFVEFDNQDVLFLYSTTLLNNSLSMK